MDESFKKWAAWVYCFVIIEIHFNQAKKKKVKLKVTKNLKEMNKFEKKNHWPVGTLCVNVCVFYWVELEGVTTWIRRLEAV